ncbi:hypothetical protein J4E83_003484 [Alternaria metachromatica]|uniref:uncharacterized protein n=1 Tax=Alternaria metachromatica TaxID=283354 RepID=UPI0020C451E5|nr:uncharacterized protein J4E83_003484 [Alternaria metachromatica]XP_049244848.1 uncharacterized protein J4E84_004472 [Alternaria hordeiaustralica]KAI4628931.1 hypothetical protein J4E83_003484 [Alternaria metachromatica]KAI4688542.1 hypothetical protein J4E84_004472 [Alternaria hordeiaustralica]
MPTEAAKAYGPLVLSDPDKAAVDIVLVHGLGGDRTGTWTERTADDKKNACFWPRDLLPVDLPDARIITWGYAAATIKTLDVVSIANPTQHAEKLCSELASLRVGVVDRPILFIAHSMGGIVAKKALLNSQDSNVDSIAPLVHDTCGIIFMGTPHCGSELANAASFLTKIVGIFHTVNSSMLEGLQSQNAQLQEIDRRFHQLLAKRVGTDKAVQVRCFCESVPFPGIGIIVPDYSAGPPGYERIVVDANHIEMTKFSKREDQTYQNVLAELRRMIKLAKEQHGDQSDPSLQRANVSHVGNNDRGALANYGSQTIGTGKGGSTHYGKCFLCHD